MRWDLIVCLAVVGIFAGSHYGIFAGIAAISAAYVLMPNSRHL